MARNGLHYINLKTDAAKDAAAALPRFFPATRSRAAVRRGPSGDAAISRIVPWAQAVWGDAQQTSIVSLLFYGRFRGARASPALSATLLPVRFVCTVFDLVFVYFGLFLFLYFRSIQFLCSWFFFLFLCCSLRGGKPRQWFLFSCLKFYSSLFVLSCVLLSANNLCTKLGAFMLLCMSRFSIKQKKIIFCPDAPNCVLINI